VVIPEIEELGEGEPEAVVVENALRKARVAASPEALVIGCDTEVVLDGRVLGKPGDEVSARGMLDALSGRTHEVLSGLAIVDGRAERSAVAATAVTFRYLDERLLSLYVSSGEWRGKAGAYAIQGLGSMLVESMEGDFSNVVGLPVRLLLGLAPELFRDSSSGPKDPSLH
jgi:septum formation protein